MRNTDTGKVSNDKKNFAYRTDIDVLRGISVTLVFVNHLFPSFKGGFIGVDIFFVISGFVIMMSLHNKAIGSGQVSMGSFVCGRFYRLYPVLLTVTLITTIISFFYSATNENWESHLRSALFSLIGTSNFYYTSSLHDYFAEQVSNPLLHTWSLSIEEQFYLVFGPIGILTYFNKKDKSKSRFLATLFLTFLASYLLSFFSNHLTLTSYYSLFPRIWEPTLGCLAFFILLHYKEILGRFGPLNYSFGWLLIIASLLLLQVCDFKFSLLIFPTLGTALILMARPPKCISYIFYNKRLAFLGKMSYSIYLTHYPVIYFTSLYFGKDSNTILITVPLTLFISLLLYNLIEQPLRRKKEYRLFIPAVNYIGVVCILCLLNIQVEIPTWASVEKNSTIAKAISKLQKENNHYITQEAKSISKPIFYLPKEFLNCHFTRHSTTEFIIENKHNHCFLKEKREFKNNLYLIGDSTIDQFHGSFSKSRHLKANVFKATFQACAFLPNISYGHPRGGKNDYCEFYMKKVIEFILSNNQKKKSIVIISYYALYEEWLNSKKLKDFVIDSKKLVKSEDIMFHIAHQLEELAKKFKENNIKLIFLKSTPILDAPPSSCLGAIEKKGCFFSLKRNIALKSQQYKQFNLMFENISKAMSSVFVIDPLNFITNDGFFNTVNMEKGFLWHYDKAHLSFQGAQSIAKPFQAEIQKILLL